MFQSSLTVQQSHRQRQLRSGKPLKHQVPVRTFSDWNDASPGFFETDLVAHCGTSAEGSFLSRLVLTDVATGWTECLALPIVANTSCPGTWACQTVAAEAAGPIRGGTPRLVSKLRVAVLFAVVQG